MTRGPRARRDTPAGGDTLAELLGPTTTDTDDPYSPTPRHVVPIGHPVCIRGLTGRVVAHTPTTDQQATIVTYRVPGLGYGTYTVEDNR